MEIISFYGTDGSGKSTIAHKFAEISTTECEVLGGSSYRSWLTPDVANQTLGHHHKLQETIETQSDLVRLYEDIAIACYGLAKHISESGKRVIIDSDPYLKRIIWETMHQTEENAQSYIQYFDDRLNEYISPNIGPNHIVGINMQAEMPHYQLLERLANRGDNSEHDPTAIDEVIALDSHVRHIWREVEKAAHDGDSKYSALNTRLGSAAIIHADNPNCAPEAFHMQIDSIALELHQNFN